MIQRANILIARAHACTWGPALAASLSPLPIDLHWSETDNEAVDLAATRGVHVAVLDANVPPGGGLHLTRRIRRMGLAFPCLLVCQETNPRLLRDALELDVFSVLEAEANKDLLTPMILKIFRRVYDTNWNNAAPN